ncbi:MAG: CoA transferase [Gammaproteobacteria bacterium]|nr:CoA transferase [Gammaproteobacteria bacterium]
MSIRKPLQGLLVLELGQLLAGPFTGSLLGYFGAEVIKIEPPAGDPIRGWRELDANGTSYWWRSLGRNKKCITIDLNTPDGRALARRLADRSDVLIENFSPGVMERWGLAPTDLKQSNPRLVYARISGYGQDGPYASKPGFASVCEGISGFRYVNGYPGDAPVRPNLSIGDTIAALHAALGIMMALRARDALPDTGGQVVDVALYESMFNLMEAVVPEFSGAGVVREPSGTTVTGIVPTNTYRCADGRHVVIGGNGDSIFRRLMDGIGRADLAADAGLAHNAGRVAREAEIDAVLGEWCAARSVAAVLSVMEQQRVPAGPIYSVREMFEDPHFRARGLFERVEIDGRELEIPALFPRLAETPGATEWAGAGIGSHTEEVLRAVLGLEQQEIRALHAAAVI